jgi:hypothetical protein
MSFTCSGIWEQFMATTSPALLNRCSHGVLVAGVCCCSQANLTNAGYVSAVAFCHCPLVLGVEVTETTCSTTYRNSSLDTNLNV